MNAERLNTITDGVMAIVLTIMVLELNVPSTLDIQGIFEILDQLGIYLLSYIYVAIYWNNHHHLFYAIEKINGKTLWINMATLFGITLIPYSTELINNTKVSTFSVVFYGLVLLYCAISYHFLISNLRSIEENKNFKKIMSKKTKETGSIILYILGIFSSIILPYLGIVFYIAVGVIWLVPEKRIEKNIQI